MRCVRGRVKTMTYSQIWEYVYEHFDLNQYFSAEDLLYDVKNMFNKTNSYFPIEAEDLIKERFQYRREYEEMERINAEQQKIADLIGSGQVPQSLSDEIVQDLRKPEIMEVDFSDLITTKEEVIPPEVRKFYEIRKETFFGRIASTFRSIFRRR